MISVTTDMILRSVLFSLILGGIFGGIYTFLRLNVLLLKKLFSCLFKRNFVMKKRPFLPEVFDFLFILTLGLAYVLLLYVFTDGVFYPVSLIALFLGFNSPISVVRRISKPYPQ